MLLFFFPKYYFFLLTSRQRCWLLNKRKPDLFCTVLNIDRGFKLLIFFLFWFAKACFFIILQLMLVVLLLEKLEVQKAIKWFM